MPTSFSRLLEMAERGPGFTTVHVPEDWMQGRSVFGGLQVALAIQAMRTVVPLTPLRTVQTTFVGPVGEGRVHIEAKILRSGKSATHVEARIVDGNGVLALVIGVFGAPRTSVVSVTPQRPEVTVEDPTELVFVAGVMPSFTQHFSAKWLRGGLPFTSDRRTESVLELGIHDQGTTSEGHVIALADFIPPIALSHLASPAPGSTLTWMIELLADRFEHLPLSGWRVDAELVAARDGYTSQSVMLWGPGGEPIAISRQAMMVFEH